MIKSGLKVGERFEDGGLYYEVQSVLPNGQYISKRVDGPKEVKEDVAEAGTVETAQNPIKKTGVKKK